jgi:hypothetical protein
MPKPSVLFAVLTPLLAVGCGQSQAAKEEAAVARLKNRPKAGFVRIVNLSGTPLPIVAKGRPIMAEVPSGGFSRLVAFGAGKGMLKAGTSEVGVDLKPGEGTSVVVFPSSRPEIIDGEVRTPGKENVRVVIAKGDGSVPFPSTGVTITGPTATKVDAATKTLSLSLGDYRVGGESVKIEPKCAYTFLLVPFENKWHVFPMLNTANERPAGAGAASS